MEAAEALFAVVAALFSFQHFGVAADSCEDAGM
jgi:hypothetical protein